MTSGHLVTRLDLPLHGNEDLDHLHHARRQVIATLQLVDLVVETGLELLHGLVELLLYAFQFVIHLVVLDDELLPLARRVFGQQVFSNPAAFLDALRSADNGVVEKQILETVKEPAFKNPALIVPILGKMLDLGPFIRHGALVLVDAAAREDPNLDHRTGHTRRHPQRGIPNV